MDFTETTIFTHVLTIYILLGIMIFNYISLSKLTDFVSIVKRLKFMTPAFHGINFTAAYTGAIVAAYSHDLSPTVVFMVVTTIVIMILEIKRYKKMRIIRSTDFKQQEEFIVYAKKIYTIEIVVLLFTFVLVKIF